MGKRFSPDYWEKRADEARIVAGQFADPESRQIMTEIADGYLQMADAVKRLGESVEMLEEEERDPAGAPFDSSAAAAHLNRY